MKISKLRASALSVALILSGLSLHSQDLQTARILTRSERFEEAEATYKEVIKKEPGNSDAYFFFGQSIIKEYLSDTFSISKNNVVKNASDLFKKGLAADTNNALNIVGLGIVELIKSGDTLKANSFFNKAYAKVPAKAAKCSDKDIKVLITLGTAQIYGNKKRPKKALEYLEKAKEASFDKKAGVGKNAEVFLAIGDVHLAANNHNEAIKNYRTALSIDTKMAEAQIRIGYLYLGAKNPTQARVAFLEAKDVDSSFAPVYRGLGEVYTAARSYKFAKENYRKFLALSGDNAPAKVAYAASLFKSQEYEEAITVIEEVLAVDNSRNYLNRLGAYSCFERRVEKGVDKTPDYEKGLKFSETFFSKTTPEAVIPKDYAYLGRLQIKLKKDSAMIDNGVKNLIKAYELDTTDIEIFNEIVKTGYYNKKYDVCISFLNKKISNGTAETSDFMMLGKAYYQNKDYANADKIFMSISEKDPNNIESYVWQANSASSKDPEMKDTVAKSKYETLIKKAQSDTVKYANDIITAYSYLANYYYKNKKMSQAIQSAQRLASISPNKKDKVKWMSFVGEIYVALNDYNRVKLAYGKLLEFDSENAAFYNGRIEWANKGIESQKKK